MTLLSSEQLDERIRQIPSLPGMVTEILEILDREQFDFILLEKTIAQEPGLAAQILRLANSPFYGVPGRILSIRQACVVLGVHTIRHAALAAGVISRFPASDRGTFDRLGFWRHAVGTGVAAKVLAKHSSQDQELAFTAGLLHDLGKLVEDVYFAEAYAEILRYRDARDCLIRDAERAILGFDHAQIGARLARKWMLPEPLIETIEKHHWPDDERPSPTVDLVHIGNTLCEGMDPQAGGDALIPPLSGSALQRLCLQWHIVLDCLFEIEALRATASGLFE